jgi:hypothetical protein
VGYVKTFPFVRACVRACVRAWIHCQLPPCVATNGKPPPPPQLRSLAYRLDDLQPCGHGARNGHLQIPRVYVFRSTPCIHRPAHACACACVCGCSQYHALVYSPSIRLDRRVGGPGGDPDAPQARSDPVFAHAMDQVRSPLSPLSFQRWLEPVTVLARASDRERV